MFCITLLSASINLIKIAEKDLRDGNVEPEAKAFAELRKELLEND
jgi:hypothetical protein